MFRIKEIDTSRVIFECPDIPENDFITECEVKYKLNAVRGIKWDNLEFEADGYTKQEIIDQVTTNIELKDIISKLKIKFNNITDRLDALESRQQKIIDQLKEV